MTAGGIVEATYLSGVVAEAIEWYWRGRIARGKLTCFDGLPGMGKTTVSLDLISRFSRGEPLPLESTPPPKLVIGILSDEDGLADTTVPRLKIAGADLDQICQLTGRTIHGFKRSLTIPDDLAEIGAIIRSEGLGYLHVDPLAAHASKGVDLYVDQDVRAQIMGPLAGLAEETGITIVLVRHPTKAQTGPAMLRGGGSMGIIGAARFGLMFGHDPHSESTRVIASTKANIGPIPPSLLFKLEGIAGSDHARVWWDPIPSDLSAEDLLPTQAQPSAKKMSAAEDWLLLTLDEAPRPATEVITAGDAAGHTERTLRRAKSELKIESTRIGGGDGVFFWCLPGQEAPAGREVAAPLPGFGVPSQNGRTEEHAPDRWTT